LQDKDMTSLPVDRTVVYMERARALLESESTRLAAEQLEHSLTQLIEIQQFLQLRVQWTPEQIKRQQERLERQRARLHWQQAMLKQLREE